MTNTPTTDNSQARQVMDRMQDQLTPASARHLIDNAMRCAVIGREEAVRLYDAYLAGLRQQKLYLIGSLRNTFVPSLAARLRASCPETEIFDDWYAAGPEADDEWKSYEQARQRPYVEALNGYSAGHVFDFDRHHLDTSSHALLVLPAGKSGHMEIMYAAYGVGADCAILLEQGADPRWDVMYKFIPNVFETIEEVEQWLTK